MVQFASGGKFVCKRSYWCMSPEPYPDIPFDWPCVHHLFGDINSKTSNTAKQYTEIQKLKRVRNKYRQVWAALKAHHQKLSSPKSWYCTVLPFEVAGSGAGTAAVQHALHAVPPLCYAHDTWTQNCLNSTQHRKTKTWAWTHPVICVFDWCAPTGSFKRFSPNSVLWFWSFELKQWDT